MFPTSDSKETQTWIMEGVADKADRAGETKKSNACRPNRKKPRQAQARAVLTLRRMQSLAGGKGVSPLEPQGLELPGPSELHKQQESHGKGKGKVTRPPGHTEGQAAPDAAETLLTPLLERPFFP